MQQQLPFMSKAGQSVLVLRDPQKHAPACETVIRSAGTRLAKTAEAIGMTVMGVNSKSSRSDLEDMLQVADVVSLHCSLTPKTHHLIG